jgi:hypothetical protein
MLSLTGLKAVNYNRNTQTKIGPDGHLQARTCRFVTDCKDPSYNHPEICEEWHNI